MSWRRYLQLVLCLWLPTAGLLFGGSMLLFPPGDDLVAMPGPAGWPRVLAGMVGLPLLLSMALIGVYAIILKTQSSKEPVD